MYVGVDIGGTKTLVASLDDQGVITQKIKFPTPARYEDFTRELAAAASQLEHHDFRAGTIAAPGRIDREHGIGMSFGNLPWQNVPLQADGERIFHCPLLLENDANLGGLSESMLLPADKKILYITISTGIGTGFIDRQAISEELKDSEGGHMVLEYHGKRRIWESFASGHAIVQRFHKQAEDIVDSAVWQRVAHDLVLGFIELIAIDQPDIIVIGGSVGNYLKRFEGFLVKELQQYASPLMSMPSIKQAQRPDDAVLYGCYDLARRHYESVA